MITFKEYIAEVTAREVIKTGASMLQKMQAAEKAGKPHDAEKLKNLLKRIAADATHADFSPKFRKQNGQILKYRITEDARASTIESFIDYASDYLGIENIPHIEISEDTARSKELKTYGLYQPSESSIWVY